MRHSLYLLFAVAIQSLWCADIKKLPTEDRRMLQDLSRFHEVHSIHDLPSAIVKLCAEDGHIADPGQNWNATDAIMDPTLPAKRLIWAAIGGEYYVVHYERGGIAHTFHILIAKLMKDDAKPKVVWSAGGAPLKDYAAFVDAMRSGKLDDRPDHAH